MKTVLFICTGNYYRSRFAEGLFNHKAQLARSGWSALSRGLAIHLVSGDISIHTEAAFQRRGIPRDLTSVGRNQLVSTDLDAADLIVALCEREHRPLLRAAFPEWEDRVEYWTVDDIDMETPDVALEEIAQRVSALERRLDEVV